MEINWEKKYNEALERARALREEAIEKEYVNDYVKDYEAIFPELAESEDERIRKELIKYIRDYHNLPNGYYSRDDFFSYLEKQKDKMTAEEYEKSELFQLKLKTRYANGYQDGLAQKEQKPLSPDDKVKHPLYVEGFEAGKQIGAQHESVFGKQKEQKPDLLPESICPKFAVGDTVCRPMWSDHTIREIYVRCNDPVYICVNEEGRESHIAISEQDEWEKKDQKPEWSEGDEKILVAISKALGCDTAEKILANEGVTLVMAASFLESLRPRPKQEWSEEDKRKLNRIYAILGQAADTHAFSTTCRLIGDKEAVELQDFLRSIAKQISGEWSEEDDRHRSNCLSYFNGIAKSSPYYEDYLWLKSLKNRWNSPKSNANSPSWKPSEEQMGALNYAYCELFKRGDVDHDILGPLQNLIDTLSKL